MSFIGAERAFVVSPPAFSNRLISVGPERRAPQPGTRYSGMRFPVIRPAPRRFGPIVASLLSLDLQRRAMRSLLWLGKAGAFLTILCSILVLPGLMR